MGYVVAHNRQPSSRSELSRTMLLCYLRFANGVASGHVIMEAGHRAVVLVPGWGVGKQSLMRDRLAEALRQEMSRYGGDIENGSIDGDTFKRIPSDGTDGRPTVDVYEAFWADLATPDEPSTRPLMRFLSSSRMTLYWLWPKWWVGQFRSSAVVRGLMLPGMLLLAWWVVGLVPIANAWLAINPPAAEAPADVSAKEAPAGNTNFAGDSQRPGGSEAQDAGPEVKGAEAGAGGEAGNAESAEAEIPETAEAEAPAAAPLGSGNAPAGVVYPENAGFDDAAIALLSLGTVQRAVVWFAGLATSPIYIFAVFALSLLPTLRLVEVAGFARRYLHPTDGFDRAIQQRVRDALMRVYNVPNDDGNGRHYDEVVLLGHSMGAAIAVQAIAGWGSASDNARTILVTWGSPLYTLCLRRPRVLSEVKQVYATIPLWIDIHSSRDPLSAPLEGHILHYGQANSRDVNLPQLALAKAHQQYYFEDMALAPLIDPLPRVPAAGAGQQVAQGEQAAGSI